MCVSSSTSQDDDQDGLIDIADEALEDEYRRRWLGGPWSAEDAMSIINEASDILTNKTRSRRHHRFQHQASSILELITGLDQPNMMPETDSTDDSEYSVVTDELYTLDSGHVVSDETIKKILQMNEGDPGPPVVRKRSQESIQKLYSWFRPYMIPRFKKRLSESGNRSTKLATIEKEVMRNFTSANQFMEGCCRGGLDKQPKSLISRISMPMIAGYLD